MRGNPHFLSLSFFLAGLTLFAATPRAFAGVIQGGASLDFYSEVGKGGVTSGSGVSMVGSSISNPQVCTSSKVGSMQYFPSQPKLIYVNDSQFTGQIKGEYEYCNGTSWLSMTGLLDTLNFTMPCNSNYRGLMTLDSQGNPAYCDGSNFYNMEVPKPCSYGGSTYGLNATWTQPSTGNSCSAGNTPSNCTQKYQCVASGDSLQQVAIGSPSCTCTPMSCTDQGNTYALNATWTDPVGTAPPGACPSNQAPLNCSQEKTCTAQGTTAVVSVGDTSCNCTPVCHRGSTVEFPGSKWSTSVSDQANYCSGGGTGSGCSQSESCNSSGNTVKGSINCATCPDVACGTGSLCSNGTASSVENVSSYVSGGGGVCTFKLTPTWTCQGGADTVTCHGTPFYQVCFPPNSQVLVSLQGDSRLIQDLEVGDDIMSWDPVTKSMFIDKVTHVIHHPAEPRVLLEILLENGTRIEPTPNHPIWLEEAQAYVPAQEIADRMLTLDCTTSKNQACPHLQAATGELLRVVDVRAMSENVDVYDISVAGSKTSDFSVQDQHNFFVNGLLVHNKFTNISCGLRPGTN